MAWLPWRPKGSLEPRRIGAALIFAVSIAGCATQPSAVTTAVVTPEQTNVIAADRVKDAVVVGKSTKADVIAALGDALAIRFDTGYEVWVYRLASNTRAKAGTARRTASQKAGPGRSAEFVILFAPSGLVAKTRTRPAPQPEHQG